VLEVARRKSGNYTVRRPLEIGAAMSGCGDRTLSGLGRYGTAVGEAFQLRDDLLGVFGSESVTGKPSGGDLIERKATSVVIAAYQLADAPTRRQLTDLMNAGDLDASTIDRWRTLIVTTGAVQWIEDTISERVVSACEELDGLRLAEPVRAALEKMAGVCTERME
jgi:geranylgeranyl diphosphate synthase, type I